MPTPTFSWCSIPTEQPKMPTVMSASGKTQQGGRQTGNVFLNLQMWLNTLNIQNISTLLWSIIYVFTNFHENPIIYNVLVILLYIKQTDKQAEIKQFPSKAQRRYSWFREGVFAPSRGRACLGVDCAGDECHDTVIHYFRVSR